MTKRRAALTFELALTRIAGRIGWDQVAELAGQAERTVRNYSDPDTGPAAAEAITLHVALQLDVAYRVAGGAGAPMLSCFALRVDADTAAACTDLAELNAKIARSSREHGEAIACSIAAAQHGASDAALARAELELQESAEAITDTLVAVRAARAAAKQQDAGQ